MKVTACVNKYLKEIDDETDVLMKVIEKTDKNSYVLIDIHKRLVLLGEKRLEIINRLWCLDNKIKFIV